jgi:hypothetical protein
VRVYGGVRTDVAAKDLAELDTDPWRQMDQLIDEREASLDPAAHPCGSGRPVDPRDESALPARGLDAVWTRGIGL